MKTAVGFLENAIHKYIAYVEGSHKAEPFTITQLSEAVEQAKEMFEKQIKDAWTDGNHSEMRGGKFLRIMRERYYSNKYENQTTQDLE